MINMDTLSVDEQQQIFNKLDREDHIIALFDSYDLTDPHQAEMLSAVVKYAEAKMVGHRKLSEATAWVKRTTKHHLKALHEVKTRVSKK
jgi:predicted ATP-grasp superfamily ATP-dependent carboligase